MAHNEKVYDLPVYYDIGWSSDITREIRILINILNTHVPFKVKNLLEAACGTGRFLVTFPKYGYNITGFDINPKMIEYTKNKILKSGLNNFAKIILGDMRTTVFDIKFDSAFNSINSFGYLISDEDILVHLKNISLSLNTNAVYIIHIGCVPDKIELSNSFSEWAEEKDGIRVKVRWGVEGYDKCKKLSYEYSILEINDNGKVILVEDKHTMRLWTYDDLKKLITKSRGFVIEAIYDEHNKSISLESHINGEMGNLYFVLKVI